MRLRLAVLLVIPSLVLAQPAPFPTNTRVLVGNGPNSLTVADFNGDGKKDIAVSNQTAKTVSVLLGNGAGGFTNAPGSPMSANLGDGPRAITSGDFNNDGNPDIIFLQDNTNDGLVLRLGVGDGTFLPPVTQPSSWRNPAAFRTSVADFNGDGKLDLAMDWPQNDGRSAFTGQRVLGDGAGIFAAAGTGGTATADFNGDGKVDYVGAGDPNGAIPPLSVSLSSGNFYNTTRVTSSDNIGLPIINALTPQIITADFDQDRAIDVMSLISSARYFIPQSYVKGWRGDGRGGFVPDFLHYVGGFETATVASADFDGDGILDWAVRTQNTIEIGLLRMPATANPPVRYSFPIGAGTGDIAIADFNGDGKPDIVVPNSGSNDLSLLLSGPASGLTSQTITFPAIASRPVNSTPFTPPVSASSGLAVTLASSTPGICTVTNNTVAMIAKGSCSLTASQAGNATTLPAPQVTVAFTVTGLAQTITVVPIGTVDVNSPPISLQVTTSSGLALTAVYVQSGSSCSYNNGSITLLGAGYCTLQLTQGGNSIYDLANTYFTFNITGASSNPQSQTITFDSIPDRQLSPNTFAVFPTASSGLPVTLESTTFSICKILTSTGTIWNISTTAVGTCSLKATQAGSTAFLPATLTRSFNVTAAVKQPQTLTLYSRGPTSLVVGTVSLVYVLDPAHSSSVPPVFATNTPSICQIQSVSILLVAAGTCSVSAMHPGDEYYLPSNTAIASFQIVDGPSQSQTITFPSLANYPLGVAPLTLTATASSSLPVTFTSNTPAFCTLSGTQLNLIAQGVCSITASQAGNSIWLAAPTVTRSFTITSPSGAQFQTISFTLPSSVRISQSPMTITATASSGLAVSLSSNTPAVCTIAGSTLTLVSTGQCSVTATQAGNATYQPAAPVTLSMEVTALLGQIITVPTLTDRNISSGAYFVNASASSGLAVTMTSSTPSTCTVAGQFVNPVQAGTCTLIFSQAGNITYSAAPSVTVNFTILPAGTTQPQSQTIAFAPLADRPLSSSPFTLSATASSGLAVAFTSTTPSTCNVSGASVTLAAAGTCSINASQAGNSAYAAAPSITRSFTITAPQSAKPRIDAVTNAASNIPGSLAPASYAALYGANLGPDPTLVLNDLLRIDRPLTITYSSATQINFLLPEVVGAGPGTITLTNANGTAQFSVNVARTVPGLFSSDSSGKGPAAAQVMIVNADKSITTRLVTDGPIPVLAGTEIYLVLYGTGIRGHLDNGIIARIAGRPVDVLYAGAQGTFPGLDQVNLRVPLTVGGMGIVEVQLTVDGSPSNTVTIDAR